MAKVKDKKVEMLDITEERKKQIEEAVKKVKITKIFNEKAERYTFSKVGDLLNLPNLISVQLDSYNWFITEGLTEVLKDISPIQDYNGNLILEFFGHRLEDTPKYDLEESRDRNTTYSKRLYVNVRLINKETGEIKEQEIFLGDFPIMTESGTFLINGAERVVVSQLVRSPGCYFVNVDSNSKYKTTPLYNATIMPIRGAWIEFETETAGTVFTRIDRTRKLPATTLLRALGLETVDEMVALFGEDEALLKTVEKDQIETQNEALIEIYKKLVKLQPKNHEIWAFLGYLYYENEDFSKACENLEKALDLCPIEPFVLFLLGNIYSRKGEITKAVDCYEMAIFFDFDMYIAHIDFARKYEHMGRHKKALDEYKAAYDIDSRDEGLAEKIEYLENKYKEYLSDEKIS